MQLLVAMLVVGVLITQMSLRCWFLVDNSNVIVGCYVGFWVHLNVIQMLVVILVVGTCELLR
jgi:uncharacterized membrane protein